LARTGQAELAQVVIKMRHNRKNGNLRGVTISLISFILLAAAFIGFAGHVNAEGETVIAVEPSSQSVSFNETFTVNITIDPAEPVTAAQCNLRFNSSLLTALSVTDGGMFDMWFNSSLDINNTDGTIKNIVAFNLGTTDSEKGTFAIVTFKAKGAVGISPVDLWNVEISDESATPVGVSTSNANVSVGSIPVSIEPSSKLLPANTNFSISITIDPLQPVSGAQCDITFDPLVITAVSVEDGGMFNTWFDGILSLDNVNGEIKNIIAFNNLGGTTSEKGTFAVLHFTTNNVSGTSPVGLVNVTVSDSLGNPLPVILSNGSIGVDAIPPVISYSLSGTAGNNNWYVSNVDVTLNAADEHGISEIKYRIDGNAWQNYTAPFTITADGLHTVDFYAIDTFGNNNSTSFNVSIDSTFPALSYSLSGTVGNNNWYVSNVDVTLNAADEHGISEIKYRIDDGAWQDYTTQFTISTDGLHTVQFYAIDNAGNNNSTSFSVNIDREAPTLSHAISGTAGNNNWYTGNVAVTLTATDASSDIDAIKYKINNGAWQDYSPFTLSSNGEYTIIYYAIDNAGNEASEESFTVKIDSVSPSSSATLSGTKEGGVYTTDVTVSISRTDSTSGIAYTKYRVNGGAWTTYTASFTLSTDGTYTVDYYSADNAGNVEPSKTVTFEILKNHPPTADFTYSPQNPTDTQAVHFTDNSDDTDGTIANYTWNFGDGSTSNEPNPTHQYEDNGTYTVTLTVKDDKGATDTISKQIEVSNEPPTAYFKYEPADKAKINEEVTFTDESTDTDGTIANYTWNFGDGNISYEKNPTHKYGEAGTYTITLTITDNDGATDSSSLNITIKKEQASGMLPIIAIIILIIIAILVVLVWRRRTGAKE